jgi:hypothetical protein
MLLPQAMLMEAAIHWALAPPHASAFRVVQRKQKLHLRLLSAAFEERKHNPCKHPRPTPEQEREALEKEMAERACKAREG